MKRLAIEAFLVLLDAFGEEPAEIIAGGNEVTHLDLAVLEDVS